MHFFGLVAAIAISALGLPAFGAPSPANDDPVEFHSMLAARNVSTANENWCMQNDIVGKTTTASPLAADCQQIAANIAAGGEWHVGWGGTHQVAQYGTCAIGVTVLTSMTVMKLGNQDIIKFISRSIDQFLWNGLVGSEAKMNCPDIIDGDKVTATAQFGLYHDSTE
ncbi:hypothetical protein OQA88_1228 [Cercophora sp. LCS_1]